MIVEEGRVVANVAIALGSTLAAEGYRRADGIWPVGDLVALKAPVFSMAKLLDVDTYLGPEMKSTGEVMGVDRAFAPALWKSLVAAGLAPAPRGQVLVTVADKDKPEAVPIIEGFHWLGYELVATSGTAALIRSLGLDVTEVRKLAEGDNAILDVIRSGQCAAVINTPTLGKTVDRDGFLIRRAARRVSVAGSRGDRRGGLMSRRGGLMSKNSGKRRAAPPRGGESTSLERVSSPKVRD